jgi:radical SAM enzyme (TIGR01210 family)
MRFSLPSSYPQGVAERDAWIISHRPQRNAVDPFVPYAYFSEEERSATGEVVPVATILLTNRECPWRCLMCDLWQNTLSVSVPLGAIPKQIDHALHALAPARQVKLYNSGSFFDQRAIPVEDYEAIAARLSTFERVIVECHPSLIGDACSKFRDMLSGQLEVAIGLETAHPEILEKLNKRMTTDLFVTAADRLISDHIDLRVFILVQPPFMREEESLEWSVRSLEFAFRCGATAATLIPTRGGNGALEELAVAGHFKPPSLVTLEAAFAYGIALNKGRVFVDLWNVGSIASCRHCRDRRIHRLHRMNLEQVILSQVPCTYCGGSY